jgi:hypothetical protein
VRLQISAHISNRGDVVFIDTDGSGGSGTAMSIEAVLGDAASSTSRLPTSNTRG